MNGTSKHKKLTISVFVFLTFVFFAGGTIAAQADASQQERIFSLMTNFYEYPNEKISVTLFDEIITGFDPDIWDFMTLSPDEPIDGSTFLQVGAPQENVDFQFTLEIGFYDEKSGLTMYRTYTKDKNTVMQFFIDYWQEQKIPDISTWEDVSAEMGR